MPADKGDPAEFLYRRLRVRHVQLLATLGDTGSVRAAADAMNLSQPAVSKMLGEVESAFGQRLFERERRGMLANAFGRAAIRRARVVLAELQLAASEQQALRSGGGLLRVGAFSVTDVIPVAVTRTLRAVPGCRIHIREATAEELLKELLEGELDCAFGALGPDALAHAPLEQLRLEPIMHDRLCALMSVRHPQAGAASLRWAELADEPWVAPARHTLVRQAFSTAFTDLGLSPPQPVVEVVSPVTLRALLEQDAGLIGVVRLEQRASSASAGALRMLDVLPQRPLPSLCLFTRNSSMAAEEGILPVFRHQLRLAAEATGNAIEAPAPARKPANAPRQRA